MRNETNCLQTAQIRTEESDDKEFLTETAEKFGGGGGGLAGDDADAGSRLGRRKKNVNKGT